MIQFRRGKTKNWRETKTILASGQPGYDKEKHKIKIGDGEKSWVTLPYASGLSADEILSSEKDAKKLFDPLDIFSKIIITYGTEVPDKDTVGQLYLQYYETDPETDYIVSSGINGIWTYQKWKSGIAKCWGTLPLTTSVQNAFEGSMLFYDNKTMTQIKYPFTFKNIPSEVATLQSPGGMAWLANRRKNTQSYSGVYSLISPDKLNSASYNVNLQVEGHWK